MRLAFACAALAVLSPAQQLVTPANGSRGPVLATKDGLVLPAGEFTVADLVTAVAGFLCRNFLVDDDAVAKAPAFTLQRPLALDALGSEEMLHALLATRGLAALPLDEGRGVWQIVALAPDRRTLPVAGVPWRTPEEILRRPRLRDLVMTMVPLQHADAMHVANALRHLFAVQGMWQPGVPTAAASGANLLMVHGYRDQVAPLLVLVQQLDRASAPAAPQPSPADELTRRIEALERELAALRAALPTAPAATSPAR